MELRGRRGKRVAAMLAGCALAASGLAACLFDTATPDPASGHSLAYRVLPGPRGRPCRIEVVLRAWPEDEPELFQAPVYYSDNPAYPVRGLHAADLDVRDGEGRRLSARDTVPPFPDLDGDFLILPPAARAFSYDVDLAPEDSARFGVPVPGTAAGVDLIDGAYFFILPVLGKSFATQWRAPARISLDFISAGRTLAGSDAHRDLSMPYELMFVRAAYDPARSLTRSIRGHELTVYATSDTALDLRALSEFGEGCIRLVEDSIMPLPTEKYFIGESPGFWGIEGIQGYWFNPGARTDVVAHVHEVAHTFVGVYHGDLDDPWWKEGMTDYLGWLLPFQAGLVPDTVFASQLLAKLDTVPAVQDYALSSPYLRNHLFPPLYSNYKASNDPEDFNSLVYTKGGQASMILDRWLLGHSHGRRSVFDLVRALIRDAGPAFTRPQLIEAVERLSGAPSSAFLTGLFDRTGVFPPDSLYATYRALRSLGRFGPLGGKLPVPGADGPAAKRSASEVTRALPHGGKL